LLAQFRANKIERRSNASKQLIESTIEGDTGAVSTALNKAHEQICNNLNNNNEGTFQAVICLAYFYANLKYTIVKELPAGKGVADVVMIPYVPNAPALIIELKRNKCEKTAFAQIRAKNYGAALEKYHGDLLFVGVSYDEQTKEHKCTIEKFSLALQKKPSSKKLFYRTRHKALYTIFH